MIARRLLLSLATASVALAVALAFYRPPRVAGDRTVVILVSAQEPDSLAPLFGSMMASFEVRSPTSCDLVYRDDHWNLIPDLATEIPSIDAGTIRPFDETDADGTVHRRMQTIWHLRPDARWQDGEPVTAEDIIFAHELALDESLPVVARDVDVRISSMEAPAPHTLVVNWKEPYVWATDGHICLPAHQLRPIYEAMRDRFHLQREVAITPLGNGPYRITDWRPGQYLVLDRWDGFWGTPTPTIDRLIYAVIPDTTSAAVALEAGLADALTPVGTQLRTALALERRAPERVAAAIVPGIVWEHIDMKADTPELSDVRVRRALLHAIDRDEIVRSVYYGRFRVAHSWLPPEHEGYDPALDTSGHDRYDPDEARRLLDEAGWRLPPGGRVRVNAEGRELRIELATTAGNKERELVEQLLQGYWAAIGVACDIRNQVASAFFDAIGQRNYRHLALYAWIFGPTTDGETFWTSQNIPTEANGWSGQNYPGISDPRLDDLHHRIPTTLDAVERRALCIEEQRAWVEDLPSIPLYWHVESSARSRDLEGWRPTGTSTPVTWNAAAWRLHRGGAR